MTNPRLKSVKPYEAELGKNKTEEKEEDSASVHVDDHNETVTVPVQASAGVPSSVLENGSITTGRQSSNSSLFREDATAGQGTTELHCIMHI